MEDATSLAIWIASAGLEFDRCGRCDLFGVGRVEHRSAEFEPNHESPAQMSSLMTARYRFGAEWLLPIGGLIHQR